MVAGDIGGSFGMKSAVYNEVALVLLASKHVGRPVKWMSTRSESFLCDAQARDNVTEAELALDKNGNFLALRVHTIASIGAYLQTGMPAFTGNIGTLAGVYRTPAIHADVTAVFTHTNPVRPYRGNGRPEAAYVIERHGRSRRRRARHRSRPSCGGAITFRPTAMPFKTGLTFTYDSGEFEKSMDMALELADVAGFERRRDRRARAASCAASAFPTPSNARPRGASRARKSGSISPAAVTLLDGQRHPGPGPRDHLQADHVRPARARSRRRALHPGRHRPGLSRRGHRRLAFRHARRVGGRPRLRNESPTRPSRSRRISSSSTPTRSTLPTACSPAQRPIAP